MEQQRADELAQAQQAQEDLRTKSKATIENLKQQHATEQEAARQAAADKLEQLKQEYLAAQEAARKKAEETMALLEAEYTANREQLQADSTARLMAKDKEIEKLNMEIRSLNHNLQTTRNELGESKDVVAALEMELDEKEAILTSLRAERASVRAMTKQSWNVVKTRVKKRLGRGGEKELEEGEDLDDMTMDGGEDDLGTDTKALDAANPDETEMITVGKNGKTT